MSHSDKAKVSVENSEMPAGMTEIKWVCCGVKVLIWLVEVVVWGPCVCVAMLLMQFTTPFLQTLLLPTNCFFLTLGLQKGPKAELKCISYMNHNLFLEENYSQLNMGQINQSVAFLVADKCWSCIGLGGTSLQKKSTFALSTCPLWLSEFRTFPVFLFLVLWTGAVLQPRDSRLCWICQPTKSGSPQISEEGIWVHLNGGWWVCWLSELLSLVWIV